jgi:hypothetical protein
LPRAAAQDAPPEPPLEETPSDEADAVAEEDAEEGADESSEQGTVWVRHPSDLDLPGLATVTRYDLLLLHAVLLHGRPNVPTVARALDRRIAETEVAVATLIGQRLLARDDDGHVRPAPLALPAIRARLEAEAFVAVAS